MAFLIYREVIIDSTKVGSANSTNFPMLFAGTYDFLAGLANGGNVRSASGFDIGFYSDAALTTKLDWEMERYVPSTGEVVFWVRIPTLSHTADTVIYLAYDDATITTDQSNKTGVWDSFSKGVYHCPDGTTLGLNDSTTSPENGTNHGATATSGKIIGGAAALNGTGQYFTIGSGASKLQMGGAGTISLWMKPTTAANGTTQFIVNRGGGFPDYKMELNSTGHVKFGMDVRDFTAATSSGALSNGVWALVHGVYDNTAFRIYINGAADGVSAVGAGAGGYTGAGATFIGIDTNGTSNPFGGSLQEVRVVGTPRSTSWITAEYNNQSSPSTFYAIASPIGGEPGIEGLSVNGVSFPVRESTLDLQRSINNLDVFRCQIVSQDGLTFPEIDQQVLFVWDGIRRFGGLVVSARKTGYGVALPIVTDLTAQSFGAYASRRYVNEVIPAGTLKAALLVVVDYLSDYGVVLDPLQLNGPTLAILTYSYRKASAVLDELATLSGYVWEIDEYKILRMVEPGTVAAPVDMDEHDIGVGDVEVEVTRNQYANRVIVFSPTKPVSNYTEAWVGDGSTTAFELATVTTEGQTRGLVTNNGVDETLSEAGGGGTWIFNPDALPQTITKAVGGVPGSGHSITLVVFTGSLTIVGQADDAAAQLANGLWELVIPAPEDVTSRLAVQALADAALLQHVAQPQLVKYETDDLSLRPLQTQHILITNRGVDGDFLITEVVIRDVQGVRLRASVSTIEGDVYQGGWQDTYKVWNGAPSAAGA